MDTKDKNQELTAHGFMPPDSVASPLQLDPELAELSNSELAAALKIEPESLKEEKKKKPPTPLQDSLRRLRRDKRAMASVGVILFFVLLAIFGPSIYLHIGGPYQSPLNGTVGPQVYHSYYHQELDRQDEGPSAQYWLGTDDLGRDLLARLMQGILISISVAVLVEVVDVVLGILVGVLAGYYGGWIDQVLARFTDIIFAFPGLLFIILVAGIFGEWADTNLSNIPIIGANGNARLLLVSLALAFVAWPLMARYVRGQTLQLKEQQFIEAARTAGTKDSRIILRHIIPNLFSIVVVASTLNIVGTIIGEAGISLLGLGVQSPGSSIGLMIAQAQNLVDTHPWEILLPSGVLALIVLAFSFFGDGLRDAFDPRSKD
ncbi:MAG TPA: ABC transporter permease [Ktedonobacter sp.]|jgi:peptide/nickel transport system permease protein|nr:ABC transporter permease [Ktedonobacter sp.]HAG97512.1 ABC transporter permease [Ktedonobacter sp.]HAT45812.1 ABC transporter permease [Ktedonobacter sp.]HBE26235.1 ABC transporter permease [Ktedonobacter sp.]HCF84651.1 ABC transporter permease [Ktedonobacter sp.]